MKNSILSLKGTQVLSKKEQKLIKGAGSCCSPESPWGIRFPDLCNSMPRCVLQ